MSEKLAINSTEEAPDKTVVEPEVKQQEEANNLSEHERAMIQKANENRGDEPEVTDESEQEEQPKAERPSWMPEEYWDADKGQPKEDFETLFKKGEDTTEDDTAEDKPEDKPEEDASEAKPNELLENISKKVDEGNELDESDYEQLEKQGISRDYVDAYREGLSAKQQLNEAYKEIAEMKAHAIVGSAAEYSAMTQWAAANLSEAEIKMFNANVGDKDLYEAAIADLHRRYQQSDGYESDPLRGSNSGGGIDYIKNKSELVKRMSDPRYKKDANYRKQVERDLMMSRKRGFNPYAD